MCGMFSRMLKSGLISEGYESASRTSQSSSTYITIYVNLNADEDKQELYNDEFDTAHQPIGVKKVKLKRKETIEQTKTNFLGALSRWTWPELFLGLDSWL